MRFSLIIMLVITMNSDIIFDFNKSTNINSWRIVDDVVMGGRSSSEFILDEQGFGVFKGNVSLENNGGFSSVRYRFKKKNVSNENKIVLKIKGDGKAYQLRIKNNSNNYYSYIKAFSTSGKWEKIEISLEDMFPSFRGRKLNKSNFNHEFIEEIAFLISNKKNENFKLLIDFIKIK